MVAMAAFPGGASRASPWPLLAALGAALLLLAGPALADDILVKTFSDQGTERFNHLVVDKNTGRVFIGAVNKLYQLSPDLDLVIAETTGPKDDHPDCSVLLDCPVNIVVKATDNVNKALVIDYTTTRLISCGSVYQGICHVRNLHNISDVSQIVKEAVVANNATASTVAFIAPGPPNPPVSQVMYVGVTYTGNSPYRSELPAVSSRSLDTQNMFSIAETAVTTGTRQFLNSLARERYPIHYVYGFASEGFSYFMTVQMKTTSPSPFISKLVRVCHDDENYYSYTEIPIECEQPNAPGVPGKKYNLVQAAYVGKPGSDLASDLGITAQDDVLFAVFSESDNSEGEVSIKPSSRSALCVYSLKSIRRKFMQNIKSCFSGNGTRGLDFISPSHPCVLTVSRICSAEGHEVTALGRGVISQGHAVEARGLLAAVEKSSQERIAGIIRIGARVVLGAARRCSVPDDFHTIGQYRARAAPPLAPPAQRPPGGSRGCWGC